MQSKITQYEVKLLGGKQRKEISEKNCMEYLVVIFNSLTPSQKANDKLTAYQSPGNVRELQNVQQRLMLLGDSEDKLDDTTPISSVQSEASTVPASVDQPQSLMDMLGLDMNNSSDLSSLSLKKIKKRAQDLVEKEVITLVLDKTAWNRSKAARILKISYKSLLNKIKDLDLNPPSGLDF